MKKNEKYNSFPFYAILGRTWVITCNILDILMIIFIFLLQFKSFFRSISSIITIYITIPSRNNWKKRWSIEHQFKSAHCKYRDQAIGIMNNPAEKRSAIFLNSQTSPIKWGKSAKYYLVMHDEKCAHNCC